MATKQPPPMSPQGAGSLPLVQRAVEFHRRGKLGEAEKLYAATLAAQPKHFDALHGLGSLQLQQGRYAEALRYFAASLETQPSNFVALSNLGLAYANLGRFTEALACYDRALAIKPDFPEALANRGDVLRRLKWPEEALASYDRAIALKPRVADTFNNRSGALRDLNRIEEALESCDRALAIKPDHLDALNNRGCALQALNRLAEALASFDKALAINPSFTAAHNNRGNALRDIGRASDALASYDRALALQPNYADAHNGKGLALMELGRLNEAEDAIEKAIEIAPWTTRFYYDLTAIKRLKADDRHFSAMEELAKRSSSFEENEQVFLHFALGKALDDLGAHERAFGHLSQGNALRRKQIAYDEAATLAGLGRTQEAFSESFVRRREIAGDPSDVPVFVLGMPRSGTTLVEQILAAHPKVFAAGETYDFARAMLSLGGSVAEGLTSPDAVLQITPAQWREIGARYIERIRKSAPQAEKIIDKLPENFRFVGFIHLALPNARIIHTRRDPIDTCFSCYSRLFVGNIPYAYDLAELGRYYRAYQSLMDHWRRVLPGETMLNVRYEDLISDFETQARRIVACCGLDWDERCLAFYRAERQVRTASAVQVRQPIYASSVGRWRAYRPFLEPLLAALELNGNDFDGGAGAARETLMQRLIRRLWS